MQAEHSTFRCVAYHAAESGITTTIPINNCPPFGVAVRWHGKKAEHSFFLDFFVSFCIFLYQDKKKKNIKKLVDKTKDKTKRKTPGQARGDIEEFLKPYKFPFTQLFP